MRSTSARLTLGTDVMICTSTCVGMSGKLSSGRLEKYLRTSAGVTLTFLVIFSLT